MMNGLVQGFMHGQIQFGKFISALKKILLHKLLTLTQCLFIVE